MPKYLLDANIFISAHRMTYPLDVAVSFWKKLKELADADIIFSLNNVKEEIFNNQDQLKTWCKNNLKDGFFKKSESAISEYQIVVKWAASMKHYKPSAISDFLSSKGADAFLVAFALSDADNITIVTYETSRPEGKNRIKIPEPCNHFGIRYLTPIEMFREIKETF